MSGSIIKIEKAAYHASIYLDKNYVCSGALVSCQHVVTAAHCIRAKLQNDARSLTVGVGSDILNKRKIFKVHDFRVPKKYLEKRPILYYDIAVLKVSFI